MNAPFTRTTPLSSQFGGPAVFALACAKYVGVKMDGEPACSVATAAEGVNYNPSDIIVMQGIGDTLRFLFNDDFDFGARKDSARPYLLSCLFGRLLGYGAGTYQINIQALLHDNYAVLFEYVVTSTDNITDLVKISITSDGVWRIDFHTHYTGHSSATFKGRRDEILESSALGRPDDLWQRLSEVYGLEALSEKIQA